MLSDMSVAEHFDYTALEAGLPGVFGSPADAGRIELIVRRPAEGERETLDEGTLDLTEGLVGDNWLERGSKSMPDGSANPKAQLTVMNVRVAALVAGTPDRIALAGDQLFVDLDLRAANLPPGTRLSVGSAVIEVSEIPHLGCQKFMARFGKDAHRFVSSKENRWLNLRGINAFVVEPGSVRTGDAVHKLPT
jgi:hypothetical protein